MKIVLSIGYGRLHLVSSAEWLAKVGVAVRLVCGWVPRNPNGWLVRLCSKVIGRDLSKGMSKRVISKPGVEVCAMPTADFVDQGLRLVDCVLFKNHFHGEVSSVGWRFFGWKSRRYLKEADVFHCRSGAGQGGAIARAKARGLKVVVDHSIAHPAFMDKHLRGEYEKNGAIFDLGMDSPFWRQIVKDCEDADVVQVNSFFVRDTFLEQGFPPEKIRVVYLGVREDFVGLRVRKFQVPSSRFQVEGEQGKLRLLFTGGFGFRKGAEYILEALKILKERGVEFEMDVVGDYSGAKNLISRYATELNVAYGEGGTLGQRDIPDVTFHGPKPQDELKSFLANGDVYVFPSLAEGCAQSGMEAMAAGLCVVGTHESGFPITDGVDGFIIPGKSAMAIADKVERLSANRGVIDRVGSAAAKLIQENYTWQKYAENTIKVYKELLHGD